MTFFHLTLQAIEIFISDNDAASTNSGIKVLAQLHLMGGAEVVENKTVLFDIMGGTPRGRSGP